MGRKLRDTRGLGSVVGCLEPAEDKEMPPSGYKNEEVVGLVGFLRGCSRALDNERREKKLTPAQALASECASITRALDGGMFSEAQRAVLEITRDFYKRVGAEKPATESFSRCVDHALEDFAAEILSIHVGPGDVGVGVEREVRRGGQA